MGEVRQPQFGDACADSKSRSERIGRIASECVARWEAGEDVSEEAVIARHPDLMPELGRRLRQARLIAAAAQQADREPDDPCDGLSETLGGSVQDVTPGGLCIRCPHCQSPMELLPDAPLVEIACSSCGGTFSLVDEAESTGTAAPVSHVGKFQLIDRLGMGAFGSVWKARDTELDRIVAVKIPRRGEISGDEAARFLREARAAAQLRHPNIVPVHEVGREGDLLYIVSDFVRGVSLSERLTNERLTHRKAAELGAKIADALHHAHEAGIVHRDLKPSNIMVDPAGEPHLMDFGLAKREAGEITMTIEGVPLGTPAYMSPEQAAGEMKKVDRRSDVYSLGVILFQMLVGKLPFSGTKRMLLERVIHDDPPRPRKLDAKVDRDLETICLACLEKSPERRYQTARDVAEELQRWLRGEAIERRPIGRWRRAWRWTKKRPAAVASAASVLACAILATALVAFPRQVDSVGDSAAELAEMFRLVNLSTVHRPTNPDRAALLAIRAIEATPTPHAEALEALYESLFAVRESDADKPPSSVRVPAVLGTHGRPIEYVTFVANSRWLLCEDSDRSLVLMPLVGDDATRAGIVILRGEERGPQPVLWSRSGRWAACIDRQGVPLLWDLGASTPSGHRLELPPPASKVNPEWNWVMFGPRNEWLASGDSLGSVAFWDLRSAEPWDRPRSVHAVSAAVRNVSFDRQGRWFAAGCEDGAARLWRLQGESPPSKPYHLRGDDGSGSVEFVAFAPNGKWLVTGEASGPVNLWDVQSRRPSEHPRRMPHPGLARIGFGPGGSWMASAGTQDSTSSIFLWNMNESKPSTVILRKYPLQNSPGTQSISFDPRGRWLVTSGESVVVWDLSDVGSPPRPFAVLEEGDRRKAVFAPTIGGWLLTRRDDAIAEDRPVEGRDFHLWDLRGDKPPKESLDLKGLDDNQLHSAHIDASGKWLATAGANGNIYLRQLQGADGFPKRIELSTGGRRVNAIAWDPKGAKLAAGLNDGSVWLWTTDAKVLIQEARQMVKRIRGSAEFTAAERREFLIKD